jgi:hypothetical protein
MTANLVLVCLVAFATVMILLTFLAVVISGITRAFPVGSKTDSIDLTVVASINSVVATRFSGARVTRIEEQN